MPPRVETPDARTLRRQTRETYSQPNKALLRPQDVPHAQADRVVVLGSLHARVKETGRSYDNEWAMVWTLRDGKVAGWQIYEDTARELAAHAA
jgi:ketosteroid isomerase-like protein